MKRYYYKSENRYNASLAHHGIKGMHWGKRNGPPYPLGYSEHTAEQKQKNPKALIDGNENTNPKKSKSKNQNGIKKKSDTRDDLEMDKDARMMKSINSKKTETTSNGQTKEGFLSKHRQNLVAKYENAGYSKNVAETLANRRIKIEIVVGVAGTVAVAAIGAKVATRVGHEYMDKTFNSGFQIQNINADDSNTFKDSPFYAAVNKHDKKTYARLYPTEKKDMVDFEKIFEPNRTSTDIYKNVIQLNSNVKRASNSHARKIFESKMANDSNFATQVRNTIKDTAYGYDFDELEKMHSKKMYDRFNQALATPEFQKAGIHKKFYSELQKNGYNAILDVNDMKYSGYRNVVKSPAIFFGDKWDKLSSEKVDVDKLRDERMKNVYKALGPYLAEQYGIRVALVGGLAATGRETRREKIINDYYKAHPDSKLKEKEILRNYRGKRK